MCEQELVNGISRDGGCKNDQNANNDLLHMS